MNKEIKSLIRKHELIIKQLNKMLNSKEVVVKQQVIIRARDFICNADVILDLVNKAFECNALDRTRKHPNVFARHFLCYFLHEHTRMTLVQIASYIGLADHSSVINGVKQTNNLIATDDYFKNMEANIRMMLQENKL
jgi:chromosomal replication initiator protein